MARSLTAQKRAITDAEMPEMNGIEAMQEVWRETPVPVVVVSAGGPDRFREPTPPGCVAHFLRKPVGRADLEGVIALAVRS